MALAQIISRLFEPMIVLFVLMITAAIRTGSSGWFVAYITVFFSVVWSVRFWMVRRWKLDWDISERHKRIRPLIIILGIVFFNVFVMRSWHNRELTNLFYLFAVWLFGFFLITLKYKISGHVGVITVAGLYWNPLLLFVPLVAWSRVALKRHTPKEVTLGFMYSFFIYEIWQSIF